MVSGLRAQELFLGDKKDNVIAILKSAGYIIVDTGLTKTDNLSLIHFKKTSDFDFYEYFNQTQVCVASAVKFNDKSALTDQIGSLNNKYNNIGSYSWLDKDAKFKITLVIDDDCFTLLYNKL